MVFEKSYHTHALTVFSCTSSTNPLEKVIERLADLRPDVDATEALEMLDVTQRNDAAVAVGGAALAVFALSNLFSNSDNNNEDKYKKGKSSRQSGIFW